MVHALLRKIPFMSATIRTLFVATIALTSATTVSSAQDGMFDGVSLGVGAFAFVTPKYEGSDEYGVGGVPIAFPVFNNGISEERSRVAFRGLDDVRVTVLRQGGFDVGPVVGYRFGRDEDVSDKLTGLGDVDGGLVVGGFAAYTMGGFSVDGAVSSQVTGDGDYGVTAEIAAGYEHSLTDRVTLGGRVMADYASDDYMDQYFSISAAQAANSAEGYSAFDAGAGFKSVGADLSLSFAATDRLSLRTSAGYSRLIGDAADSPISEADNQFRGGAGFTFQF